MTSPTGGVCIGIVLLGTALAGTGCSKARQEGRKAGDAAPGEAAELLADAPKGWEQFLAWAEREVAKTPPTVPVPANPTLPEPRWKVTRLTERLPAAHVQCDWQPPTGGTKAIATLGPFRSDMPTANLQVQRKTTWLGTRVWLRIQGFSVPREQVGSVSIDIHIPFGRHLDLAWGIDGRVRLPLPDNRRSWKLTVATDRFAEWTGPLEMLALGTDGAGDGPIEINAIRFLGHESSFPSSVGVRRVNIEREVRDTLYMHCPAEVTFRDVTLPPRAKLQVGLGQIGAPAASHSADKASPSAARLTFDVVVEHDGQRSSILSEQVEARAPWTDVSASLGPWGGQTVSLVFKVSGDESRAIACWGSPVVYEPATDPPCVILYLIDALGSKHIDLYGYARPTMPRLRQLAERGVWFANMFANSNRTVESVADILLSLPTERHGVWHTSVRIPSGLVTVPESLQAAGFATALFSTNVYAGPRQNVDRGFDSFFDRISHFWWGNADRTVPIDDVRTWLDLHCDRPTFIYIHTAEPHSPYTPPSGFAGRFDPNYAGRIDGTNDPERGFRRARSPRDVAHVVALYDEEVAYADAQLGACLDALAEAGLRERVNILVIADHGEEFLEHGNWMHGRDLHAELLRIPLVAAGPLVTARGRQDVPAQIYDLVPTILDMFGLPRPYRLAGTSLWPLMAGDGDAEAANRLRNRLIMASNYIFWPAGVLEFALIESGRWKLMHRFYDERGQQLQGDRFALFDLEADPNEQNNVISTHPDIARRLIARLLQWRRAQAPFKPDSETEGLTFDGEQLDELRALGYILDEEPQTPEDQVGP